MYFRDTSNSLKLGVNLLQREGQVKQQWTVRRTLMVKSNPCMADLQVKSA